MHHRFDEGALLRILDMRHHMEYSIDADGNSANFLVIAALVLLYIRDHEPPPERQIQFDEEKETTSHWHFYL